MINRSLIFMVLLLASTASAFSQDSLKRNYEMKMFHIATSAYLDTAKVLTAYETMDLKLDSTLMVLSLVDRDGSITKNWSNFIETYRKGNYLIVVDSGDGTDKADFVKYFYGQWLNGSSIEEAYRLTSERSKNVTPRLLHFLNLRK